MQQITAVTQSKVLVVVFVGGCKMLHTSCLLQYFLFSLFFSRLFIFAYFLYCSCRCCCSSCYYCLYQNLIKKYVVETKLKQDSWILSVHLLSFFFFQLFIKMQIYLYVCLQDILFF